MHRSNQKSRRPRKRSSKKNKKRAEIARLPLGGLTNRMRQVFADQVQVPLHFYPASTLVLNNNGNTYTNIRYRVNSAYDIDPLFSSASIVGFPEWAGIYYSYRVVGVRFKITFVNQEAFPCNVFVVPLASGVDPGANSSSAYEFQMLPYSRNSTVASKPTRPEKVVGNISLAKLTSNQVLTDDNYAAAVTSNPVIPIWMVIGAQSLSGATFTIGNGIPVDLHIWLDTIFYRRKDLTT
jgi:hypothetical protein